MTRTLAGLAVRQLIIVAPIEEGCKLAGIVTFRLLVRRRGDGRSPATSIFIQTIAIALGFTAQENWVYLSNGVATALDRAIGTPIHAMFSAAFGYALAREQSSVISYQLSVKEGDKSQESGVRSFPHPTPYTLNPTPHSSLTTTQLISAKRLRRSLLHYSLLTAIICHALVNIFSRAWRYNSPLNFLSYLLFPFLLWLFWRMEGWWRRVQSQPPIVLISGMTSIHRHWQRGLVVFALMLGGNAFFGFFLLLRTLSSLRPTQMLEPDIFWSIALRLVLNLIPGLIAWGIYRYLRFAASRRNLA